MQFTYLKNETKKHLYTEPLIDILDDKFKLKNPRQLKSSQCCFNTKNYLFMKMFYRIVTN